MSEWEALRLEDIMTIKHGYAYEGAYFSETGPGPRLVTPGNFTIGGGWQDGKPKFYLAPDPEEYRLKVGDLIVTMTDLSKTGDTLGYPALVPTGGPFLHNQRIGLVNLTNQSRVDKRYLYYLLHSRSYRNHVLATATGSTVRHTSPSRILEFECVVPPLDEQRAIAWVLSTLDEEIDLNRRIIRLADLTWRSLMSKAQADGSWSERPLSALASFINGRAFTKNATGTGRMVARIAELNSGPSKSTVYNDIDVPIEHLVVPGDLLFAWSGSLTVQRWFRPEAIVNQHIFKVVPNEGFPVWFLHGALLDQLPFFRGIASDKATTMGHIQRHHLDEVVSVPSPEELVKLDRACFPLWRRALAAERETLVLLETRDSLLPQLISGQVRVRDVDSLVEATV
jgi:type I restriction enzyme S subunit